MQDANIVIYQIFFTSLVWLNTLLKCESQDRRVHEPEPDFFSKNRCSSNFLSKSNKMFQKLTRLFVPLKLHEIDFFYLFGPNLPGANFERIQWDTGGFCIAIDQVAGVGEHFQKVTFGCKLKIEFNLLPIIIFVPHLLTWYCDFHCGSSLLYRFRVNFLFRTFSSS